MCIEGKPRVTNSPFEHCLGQRTDLSAFQRRVHELEGHQHYTSHIEVRLVLTVLIQAA